MRIAKLLKFTAWNPSTPVANSALPLGLLIVSLGGTSLPAHGQNANVYGFGGGACPSQGAWTQSALRQTETISGIVRDLRDNPDCKGIGQLLTHLNRATHGLQVPADQRATQQEIEALPGEISALRNAAINPDNGQTDPSIARILFSKTLQSARLSSMASLQSVASLIGTADVSKQQVLKSFFKSSARATRIGMDALAAFYTALPQYESCLIGRPSQGLALVTAAVQIGASLSASGESVGSTLGNAMNSFIEMVRQEKFNHALRNLDTTQFWMSMGCLMESVAKNACDTMNAQEILSYSKQRFLDARKSSELNADNPLDGYFLLVREIPLISQWIQRVQFGVNPKLSADADFKNKIWDEVTDFTKVVNSLIGNFNEQMLFYRELNDLSGKRNHLFSILQDIVVRMTGQTDAAGGAERFFTTTVNEALLPFYLIGLNQIPVACRSGNANTIPKRWDNWMRSGGNDGGFVGFFDDPDKLAMVIESRMNEIIQSTSQKQSAYFRQRLVVDMPNLVNQTLTGQTLTVRTAFENVHKYLVRLEGKLTRQTEDLIILPSVRETRLKIQRFLKAYDLLRSLGDRMAVDPTKSPELEKEIATAARHIIDTVYNEFNILFQRDTFLANRVSTFVEKDFSLRVRAGLNMTPYQQDLLVITQKQLLDKMIEIHGINPTTAAMDLANAQVIHYRNLSALSKVFTDSLQRMLLDLHTITHGRESATEIEGKIREKDRRMARIVGLAGAGFWSSGMIGTPTDLLGRLIDGFITPGLSAQNRRPDFYNTSARRSWAASGQREDKYGSYHQLKAKFCALTLSLPTRGAFADICRDSVLESYFSRDQRSDLHLRYADYLSSGSHPGNRNHGGASSPVCAFERFQIRNMVQWLKEQERGDYDGAL